MPYADPERQKQAQREHYRNNQDSYRRDRKTNRQQRVDFVKKAKDVPCTDCGRRYPHYVMDLDHLDESTKSFCVAEGIRSAGMSQLKAEVAKCDVVCANCHRERTWKRSQGIEVPRLGIEPSKMSV